ncbi:MAG: dihydrofolate reductase family protein [Cyclobacteriaceae bacterium]
MRKIIVLSMITLDGVMQAPGGPKEDTSGGFNYGGWTKPYGDEVYGKAVQKELNQPVDYLLGRKTFEIWEAYWPEHADFWPGINEGTKYVLSKTRKKARLSAGQAGWKNSVFLKSVADIKKVKKSKGSDIQVWGSSKLVQLLLKNDLVDELRLKIHPLTLGKGKKLFDRGVIPASFTLVESSITTTGVILVNYKRPASARDRKVKTGTVGSTIQ